MVATTDKRATVSVVSDDPNNDGQPTIEIIDLAKGTTVERLKGSLGLGPGWKISFPGEKELPDATDIYELVNPKKNQLTATPRMDVGINGGPSGPPTLSPVRRVTSPAPRRVSPARGVAPVRPPVILPMPTPKRVTPLAPPLWQQQDWEQTEPDTYTGTYVTPYGRYPGYLRQDGDHYVAGLYDKPAETAAHPHWQCLWADGLYWYLHFISAPKTMDAAIQGMQHYLTESYCLAHPHRAHFKEVLKRSFNF